MAKKLNKVFLNPTAEQISEYELIEGITWFTDMDVLANAIEADQEKKPPEQIYTLKNFQIIDGARDLTANLSKIAKQTGFSLSNDLSKVIDRAKTVINYEADSTTDHRVASTAAEGTAELSDFKRPVEASQITIKRNWYNPTVQDQKSYEEDIKFYEDNFDIAGSPIGSNKIIGYKDLTLTNFGSKADHVEEGEAFDEKKAIISQYYTADIKAGDFSFDYQFDSVSEADKKNPSSIIESGKKTVKMSGAASGTLTVKDSVIGSVGPSFSENADEIKSLYTDKKVNKLVNDLNKNAGSYETVTIDNSTVLGTIQGGKFTHDETSSFKDETFLDKEEKSGKYYNAVTGETDLDSTTPNNKLFIAAKDTFTLTQSEVEALEAKNYTVSENAPMDNIQVYKYEIVSFDINGDELKTGKYVYISEQEFLNLSDGNRKSLVLVGTEPVEPAGWVDYDPVNRVVTDDNYQSFSKAPEGAAASKNEVNKYVFADKVDPKKTVTYYLTAVEADDTGIKDSLTEAGYDTTPASIVYGGFLRVADSVNADTYKTQAIDAYSTESTTYKIYTATISMSASEALAANEEGISSGKFALTKTLVEDTDKALFCMSNFTKDDNGNSVETKYYLSASEMSAMGFFGEGIVKTYADIIGLAAGDLAREDWAFTDNATGVDRAAGMFRLGKAATEDHLADYTTDKAGVVTEETVYFYNRYALSYTTVEADLLKDVVTDADQWKALIDNNLVGEGSEYVTVIDGKSCVMYQKYGYGATVNNPSVTVTTDDFTRNVAEIEYNGLVQEALWEKDAKIKKYDASLVDGVKTQNTKKFFDQFADSDGEYVAATPAEEESGEKYHNFITVAEKRDRGTTAEPTLYVGEVITDVQAKVEKTPGSGEYVAAYIDRNTGKLTPDDKDADNTAINYYKGYDTDNNIYALTEAEATLAAGAALLDSATPLFYFTTATKNGWFADEAAAKGAIGEDAKKVDQPAYRDYKVTIADASTDISDGAYTTLKQAGQLTDEANYLFEKAYVTEAYNTPYYPIESDANHNYERVQKDGQDAYWQWGTHTIVTNETVTFNAIYKWALLDDESEKGGKSVDGLTYYMTEDEKAKAIIGDGYPETKVFEKISDTPLYDSGYCYRLNKGALDKNAYLTYNKKDIFTSSYDEGSTYSQVNRPVYNNITYVVGEQVYKYTLEGDTANTYYLTDAEAKSIGGKWGGALTQGDKVEGAVHYGKAASYAAEDKANFTKDGTVYYFTDDYTGWCITQDSEGKATQAFDKNGNIWSNINGVTWTVDGTETKYSYFETDQCENTYNYIYAGDREGEDAWTVEQIEKIRAAEEAAGIATWKVEELEDGQVVWTRTSAIGEVSTYTMDHEDVELDFNVKDNSTKEATGSIDVINGSEVRSAINGYLNVTVTDSKVANVSGGKEVNTATETFSTAKGSIAKDNTLAITTKESEKTEKTKTGTGSFTISRTDSDKIYTDAANVSGYEKVSVTGVNIGDLSVSSTKETNEKTEQITYQGDADALRGDYIENFAELAFSGGIVSKINAQTDKMKSTSASIGSAEITGRGYVFEPGLGKDTYNQVGNIRGYSKVTLTNAAAEDITTLDKVFEKQSSYKLSTKNNVDTAATTYKDKTDIKAVAELTAVNTVTNPEIEADLTIGDINGYKKVTTENYSFGNANAMGDKTISTTKSTVRDAVASDMRLINAGVDQNTGAVNPANGTKKYEYGPTTSITTDSYANTDMSYSNEESTKLSANGTLAATGRDYTVVTVENYVKPQVFAYTHKASGRTYYLTENQFKWIQTGSKADEDQWDKDSETTIFHRNSSDAVYYAGNVTAAQAVYKCTDKAEDPTVTLYLTEGELADYNRYATANEMATLTKSGDASLRKYNYDKAYFSIDTSAVDNYSDNVGTLAGVWNYVNDKAEHQFLTEAEAAELGGWTKDTGDTAEYVRKANAGDDRSGTSVIAKADTEALKLYQNRYDKSLFFVLNDNEAAFFNDTDSNTDSSIKLENYDVLEGQGYRLKAVSATLGAYVGYVSDKAGYSTTIVKNAHSYVKLNEDKEIVEQVYVTDAEYDILKAAGAALEGYVADNGSYEVAMPGYNEAKTQYQFRNSGFVVDKDTTLVMLGDNTEAIEAYELWGWPLSEEEAAATNIYTGNEKSEFVLTGIEETAPGHTTFGSITGYKEVVLSDMDGGGIFRLTDADTTTEKTTYKKTIAKGSGKTKGKTTYTENDSYKSTQTWSADGSVTLIDSKVGDIVGYKKLDVMTVDGTVKVGTISRTAQYSVDDKYSTEWTNKQVTEDTASSFKVTATNQMKNSWSGTSTGSVSLVGQRAGEALVLDDKVYTTSKDAFDAAKKAIADHNDKQFADIVLTGNVIGYQDVTLENVTITSSYISFDGGKSSSSSNTDHTSVTIADNAKESVTVTNKVNDSYTGSSTAAGTLTLTNVNYAGSYTAGFDSAPGYTTVSEYVFNGKTYALTSDANLGEKAALLEYAQVKTGYEAVSREDASITVPAVTLTGTLQDVKNVEGMNGYAQDEVYFAATAKNGKGDLTHLFIRSDSVNDLFDGKIADLEDPSAKYTEANIDTTKEYYGKAPLTQCYLATGEKFDNFADKIEADVKKYVVTVDDKAATYYLTDAEANVMKFDGMNVTPDADTKAYTRMTSVGIPAVTVDTAAIAAADDGDVETVYEYRGVVNGESVSYYLTDAEAAALDPAVYVNFGKVGTATYVRFPKDIAGDVTKADVNSLRTAVKKYTKADNPDIYLTGAEFDLIKAVDSATYGGYAVEPGEKTYYRSAGSKAFEVQGSAVLDAQFTSVNESAEVFKVTNNNTSLTLGYLTRAEILALTDADALKGYTVDFDTTYLRAAGDTTNIIQINDLTGGYVVAPGKDLAADYFIAKVTEPTVDEANAYRFQTVTLTNSKMGYLSGGASTSKGTDKLAAKKNSTIATFTRTSDSSETATGSLTAYDSSIGTAYKFDKVLLSGSEMGKYSAGDIEGGKYTYSRKAVFTSQLYDNVYDYTDSTKVLEYTETIKETFTATGSALLLNVTAGDILDYKDVTVSFDNGEDLAKNTVGSYRGIKGGTSSSTSTTTFANVDYGSYSETIEKATETAVGTVTLTNANVNGEVTGFQTANIANSEILYGLSSGNFTTTTTRVDVDYAPDSYAEEITVAAVGKATVTESKVGGSIAQFKDVELAGGVEVKGSIIVGDVDSDTPVRGASKNTACYAVFFKDSSDDLEKVVYLTEAEYKVFATKEVTAMIDPLVSVYRTKKAMTDAELKNVDKAVQDMKDYCTGYTDNAVSDSGYGQEGKNTTTWIVKTAGSSLTIDEAGATVGGKVKGYASVTVSGDSSFAAGFFGTDKTDKLTVDASLATFTTTDPVSGNPVGFDFGEGKDELVLNGTVGIQAAFKYDEATGTNAWNLETVSGSGTIVCRTEDVEDVKAAFDGINVVGSDNYNATSALKYQSVDEAKGMDNHDEFNEWLGFCDKADFFTNDLGADSILSFSGAGVDSGDVVAQMSIDGGATFATTLNDGDTIVKGAVVRVSFSTGSKNTTSSDYTIAFK